VAVREKSFEPEAACPLDGVRVIDLSRLVAGNAVSSQLADFGAEVLKIEDPQKGDPLRAWQTKGVSVHWKLYARNKKSVALSPRDRRGRDLLLDLIASSEVLIENFRPGTLEKMGLGPEVLQARNPRLVVVRVSGWGQDGPYRDRPGFGTLVESMSGYAARTGFADREPVLPPTALADMVAGLYGAFAVMVALRRVEVEGGGGQVIDLPLLDPLFSFIATEAPDAESGQLTMHNVIPRLSETPGRLRLPAPRLGEHTEEILGQFGIDRARLEALARDGVIGLGSS